MNGLSEEEISTVLEMRTEAITRLTDELRDLDKEYKAVLAANGNLRKELEGSREQNGKLQRLVAKLQETRPTVNDRDEREIAGDSVLASTERILEIFRTSSLSLHPRQDDPFLPGRVQDVLAQLVELTRRNKDEYVSAERFEHACSQIKLFREKADQWKR
eukprot:763707-Hanusia_phi.AAC.2